MSDNPFTKTNSERNAIRRLALRIRNLERRIGGPPRISYGQINSDGSIEDAGSGDWTADPGSFDGNWTITFDPPFAAAPTVIVSENETSTNPPNDIALTSVAADTVGVATYEAGVLTDDIGFNFIAIGT